MYERALGGPYLVEAMKGMSLQKVVRTVHMVLDLPRLRRQVVDVLITDLAKYFDVIAQDVHPVVSSHIGLGTKDHLFTHTEGYHYTIPLEPCKVSCLSSR